MLEVNAIKKQYKNFTLNCTMSIPSGHITALVGPNGAGKSTCFKAILGLITIDEGDIKLFDKDINCLDIQDKNKMGYVLSDSFFSSYLNIKDIKMILKNMYIDFDENLFDELINKMKLPIDKQIKDFSTGMKAKIKIISALSHKAKFLLLDEPTSGLDVIARDEIIDLIRNYMIENEDASILISSHISSDIETLCDDLYVIDNGKIIIYETIDTVLNDYAIIKVTDDEYQNIDRDYIIASNKEEYGYKLLVKEKQYYLDNYKNIVIEKANLDEMIKLLIEGEKY